MIVDVLCFVELVDEVVVFIGEVDLVGFNFNKFDIFVLVEEFMCVGYNFDIWVCKFVDVQNIFYKMEQCILVVVYQFYCQSEMENVYNVMYDVCVILNVFCV